MKETVPQRNWRIRKETAQDPLALLTAYSSGNLDLDRVRAFDLLQLARAVATMRNDSKGWLVVARAEVLREYLRRCQES